MKFLPKFFFLLFLCNATISTTLGQTAGGRSAVGQGINLEQFISMLMSALPYLVVILIIGALVYKYMRNQMKPDTYKAAQKAGVKLKEGELFNWLIQRRDVNFTLDLITYAKKKGINDLNTKEIDAALSGSENMKFFIDAIAKARDKGITTNIPQLDAHALIGGDAMIYVDTLIAFKGANIEVNGELKGRIEDYFRKHQDLTFLGKIVSTLHAKGIKISEDLILKYNYVKEDVEIITKAIQKAKVAGIFVDTSVEDSDEKIVEKKPEKVIAIEFPQIISIHKSGNDVMKYIESLTKIRKTQVDLTLSDLLNYKDVEGDPHQLVDLMIKAKSANVNITVNELQEHKLIGGNIENYIDALIIIKKSGLNFTKKELEDHVIAGGKVQFYTAAVAAAKKANLEIPNAEFEAHSIKGGNPMKALSGMLAAMKFGYNLPFAHFVAIEMAQEDIGKVIKEALNPQFFTTHHFKVITQTGVHLEPSVRVSLLLKLDKMFSGTAKEVLMERVNEAIINEIESFPSHEDVLKNLDKIAHAVKKFINENESEKKLNEHSAYILVDITIPEVKLVDDIYAKLNKEKAVTDAEIMLTLAKAQVHSAEAEVEKAFAEAIKNGTAKKNDYLKMQVYKKNSDSVLDKEEKKPAEQGHGDSHDSHDTGHEEKDAHH